MSCLASWSARPVTVQVFTTITSGSRCPSSIPQERSRARRADVSYWFSRHPRVQKETRGALEDPSGDVATARVIVPLELSRHVARFLDFRRDRLLDRGLARGLARGFRRGCRLEPRLELGLRGLRLIG